MGIFGLFGKKDVKADLGKALPYMITTEFSPYRLRSNTRSSASLSVRVKNLTNEPVMASIVVEVPDKLSLDETGFTKQKEVRIGMLGANEEKNSNVDVFGNTSTDKGEYTIGVTAFVHYRDYAHVLNAAKKRTMLQVV
jgi:uncharacterized membrane protein